MRKLSIIVALLVLAGDVAGQSISPINPAVSTNGTQVFTFSGIGSAPYSCLLSGLTTGFGCSCGSSSCTLTAPANSSAQPAVNVDHGCQVAPLNSAYNAAIDTLPIDSHDVMWRTRLAQDPQYSLKYLKPHPEDVDWYTNIVTDSTPQQLMSFYETANSNNYNHTDFPMPPDRTRMMESCLDCDWSAGLDRHQSTMNPTSTVSPCQTTEIFNLYVDFENCSFTPGNPTPVTCSTATTWHMPLNYQVYIYNGGSGPWGGADGTWRLTWTTQGGGQISGTLPFDSSTWGPPPSGLTMSARTQGYDPTQDGGGGQKFSPASYANYGGVDAAGMSLNALSIKPEEWFAATQRWITSGGPSDLGHAIRTAIPNGDLRELAIPPATLSAEQVAGEDNSIVSCRNSNPVKCTAQINLGLWNPCPNYTYTMGCQFPVTLYNLSGVGTWATLNGDQTATAVDDFNFTLPYDSTLWGTCGGCGSNAYLQNNVFPYGARLRLDTTLVNIPGFCSSNSLTNWCPYAKMLLNTVAKRGIVVADGTLEGDIWSLGVESSEMHNDLLLQAAAMIRSWAAIQPLESYLKVVNTSSLYSGTQGGNLSNLPMYQQTNYHQTTITITGSTGQVSTDVLWQPTTVGTDHERLLLASGVSYQIPLWVNGNTNQGVSCTIDSGISGATVTAGGLLQMPACSPKARGNVTCVSSADSAALPLFIELDCLPIGSDSIYRVALGNWSGDNVDSSGHTWSGARQNFGFNNSNEMLGLKFSSQNGTEQSVWSPGSGCSNDTWLGTIGNRSIYSRSTNFALGGYNSGDGDFNLILPDGNYTVTVYGEPGCGNFSSGSCFGPHNTCGNTAGQNYFDLVINGAWVDSLLDGFVLAGNQNWAGWTRSYNLTVTDGHLDLRQLTRANSVYGPSLSSVSIGPQIPSCSITISGILGPGKVGQPYSGTLTASGNSYCTPPIQFTSSLHCVGTPSNVCLGNDIDGLSMAPSGLYDAGSPVNAGMAALTVQACDSELTPYCQPKLYLVHINAASGSSQGFGGSGGISVGP